MPRGRVAFRQADLTRALRAARAAGIEVAKFEIDPGTGKIIVSTITACQPVSTAEMALEEWITDHARRTKGN